MIFKGLGKKYKRIMAFVLATALFFNAWIDYGFSVFAEEEGLKVSFVGSAQVEYSGDVFAPEFSVVVANDETISVSDYVAVWKKGEEVVTEIKDAGTYILTVTANIKTNPDSEETEEMTGTGTFTVTPIDLTNCEIVVDSSFSAIYDGSEKQPTEGQIRLERNGNTIAKENYTLGITPATNVGESITVTATVTDGNVNHTGSKSSSIDIQPLEFSENNITIEGLEASYPYTDNAITPEITVKGNNVTWVEDADYTVSYLNNRYISTNESSANVVITRLPNGANSKNYAGETITKSFEIVPLGGVSEISVSGTQNDGYTEWYTGEVTLTAPEGCTIGTDLSEKENWSNTLVIPVSQVVSYYLKNANGYITAVRNIDIKIDGTCPVMDTLTVTEEEVWTQEKTIPVKVSDDNLSRVYYTLDGVVTELSFEDGITNLETEIKITKEIFDAAGKEVTVIAIDKAGNTVSKTVNVKNIDRTAPAFDTNTLVEYWTNQDSFTFSLGMSESDEQSGLASIILKNEVENVIVRINEEDGEATVTGNNGEQIPEGIKEYTFVATDNAGNSLEKTFTIKVDRTAPSVQIDTDKLGENGYFKEDIYWFADANLEISLNLENTGNLDEAQKAAYKVEYSTVPFEEGKDDYAIVDLAQAKINVALVEGVTTYYFRAVDEAGNKSDVQSVKAGYDATVPVISKVEINGINAEDGWVNSAEAVDGKVQFTVSAEDEQTGISKIQYSLDGGNSYQNVNGYSDNGNNYAFTLEIPEGTHNLYIQIVNNLDKSENIAVNEFVGVDKTAPEEKAYIQFTSDSLGDNVGGTKNEDGTWSSILGVVTDTWNKIWGKETIRFEVYVKDEISGIKKLKMNYGDVQISNMNLVEGIQAFTSEDLSEYIIYSGEITTSEETVAISDFKIESITDIAGNQRENIKLGGTDDVELIYLDNVPPALKLSVENEDWDGSFNEDETYFTNKDNVSVVLTMDERFFEEKGVNNYPEVEVTANGERVEAQSNNDWEKVASEAYKWQKKITLAKTPGKEIEYQISVEKYADPSGNLMIGEGTIRNTVAEGAFTSSTFVVDGIAPTLTYTVSGNSDCAIGESVVYNNESDEDLKVTVVIEENPKYFNVENLSISMVDAESNEIIGGEFELDAYKINGKEHIYVFNCEDEIADSREFFVQVGYVDRAGNKLIAKTVEDNNSVVDGIYNSNKYIIDNVAPVFSLSYGKDARIISKSGDTWTEEDGVTPKNGCDAYFNDGIEVTFSIEDKFTKFEDDAVDHHILQIKKNGTDIYSSVVDMTMNEVSKESAAGDNQTVNVVWTNTGDVYTAKVTIPKVKDHSTDGEYQIVFANEDCAGNKMVVADTDTEDIMYSGLFENGIYTSPKLILDTKAPESKAFVKFTSDVIGDNQLTDQIISMVEAKEVEIWGKNEINFEVYVYDTYSGVKEINANKDDSITMSYDDGSENRKTVTLTEAKEKKANVNPENPNEAYTVYTGQIVTEAGAEFVITNFQIDKIWDVAGNETTSPITLDGIIYMDDVTPKLEVGYSDAYQLINMDKNDGWPTVVDENGNKVIKPQEGLTAFYNNEIKVTLTVSENTTKTITMNDDVATESALEHHKLVVMKDGKAVYTSEVGMNNDASSIGGENASGISVVWSKNDSNKEDVTYTAEVTISADKSNHLRDGDYQVTFATKDCTGNIMEAKEGSGITVTNGTYTSPVLVLDTTAPEVKAAYVDDQNRFVRTIKDKNGNDRDYFNGQINLNVTVKDRNVRYSELTSVLSETKALDIEDGVVEINGNDFNADTHLISKYLDEKYKHHVDGDDKIPSKDFNLALNADANYTIPIDFHDLAGNRAKISVDGKEYAEGYIEYVTVDKTAPEFTYKVVGALDDQGEVNGNSTGVNYKKNGTFSFSEMVETFLGFFFQTKGMEIEVTVTDDISGAHSFTYSSPESSGIGETRTSISYPSKEFKDKISVGTMKGQIYVEAFDYAKHKSDWTVGAFIVETQTGEIIFDDSATTASREEGNEKYYNKDVNMKVTFREKDAGESGIDKLEVKYDDTTKATEEYKGKGGQITYELTTDKPITTTEFNKNNIMVSASMTDNSGNVSEKEHTTIYNIDVTAPTIKVTYDNNEPYNENFYNKARVATVEITERNFDENDVVWKITSTDGPEPIIGSWSHSGEDDDSNVHTCTVTFEEDSDYTFTLEFEDKAGNKADYSQVDEFTIDKTLPVMEVTYNNNEYLNEYYYNASRTATIDILEHNFDPEGIQIHVTADNATGGASISGWTRNGDHNIATVTFANDAEYTLDIEGVDLANNELEDYEQDHFVVDQTVPELEIYDIENMSANKGEVRPAIRYYDTNYDAEGTVVVFKGYHNGEQEMEGDKSLQANGLELKLHDIPHVQENDDIYTMEATVYDLAGNSSEASVMFSVNRFGSVYTFDEATKALVGEGGKYYTNEEQDIVIVETNVDTLEFKEITCNLNGKLSTLKEGEDFDVYVDGTEATWKQYTYRIFEDNFREEGTYIITTYSEDKATNTSDNNSKGKSVEFVMDKTSPSVLISGVEDGGQYREDKHEMTIDIEDNVRIAEMIVDINGVETRFNTAQINEVDGKITMDIDSDNQWQVIKVTVIDAAGNVTNADEISVLVTANLFVQFVSNKIALYSTIGVAGTGTVAAWWFMFRKRKITGAS